jgi:hypothetical protein
MVDHCSTLTMKAAASSKTLVSLFPTTQHHLLEDHNLDTHCSENYRSQSCKQLRVFMWYFVGSIFLNIYIRSGTKKKWGYDSKTSVIKKSQNWNFGLFRVVSIVCSVSSIFFFHTSGHFWKFSSGMLCLCSAICLCVVCSVPSEFVLFMKLLTFWEQIRAARSEVLWIGWEFLCCDKLWTKTSWMRSVVII